MHGFITGLALEAKELVVGILIVNLFVFVLTWLLNSATINVLRDDITRHGELKSQSLVVHVESSLISVVGDLVGELEYAILGELEELTVVIDRSMSSPSKSFISRAINDL